MCIIYIIIIYNIIFETNKIIQLVPASYTEVDLGWESAKLLTPPSTNAIFSEWMLPLQRGFSTS